MKKKKAALFFKRCFDVTASFFGILFLLIPFAAVAVAVKCSSRGPVFFRQIRVGKNGREFRIYKFRTMVADAEKKGMQITVGGDSRVTGIGRVLRKTKVDELPQLFNVFAGQMSFVGPRPEVPHYVDMYSDYQKNVLRIKPGITELASIVYRDENDVLAKSEDPERTYIEEIMPEKIKLNMQYMQKMNVFYDIYLIFRTFAAVLKRGEK
ncbi:MAG TPA: sugar transferase [Candidatus Faecicola pullistercoris]|nr:sugar transferase [Candidatus Faecicola pullistercoris]